MPLRNDSVQMPHVRAIVPRTDVLRIVGQPLTGADNDERAASVRKASALVNEDFVPHALVAVRIGADVQNITPFTNWQFVRTGHAGQLVLVNDYMHFRHHRFVLRFGHVDNNTKHKRHHLH